MLRFPALPSRVLLTVAWEPSLMVRLGVIIVKLLACPPWVASASNPPGVPSLRVPWRMINSLALTLTLPASPDSVDAEMRLLNTSRVVKPSS